MYGIQAITANNGWAMAITGAIIVFSGLAFLSLVISQFPKLFLFLDWIGKKRTKSGKVEEPSSAEEIIVPHKMSSVVQEIARAYKPIIDQLPPTFSLTSLYAVSNEYNFPHPYISISRLREAEILIPAGEEGIFQWNNTIGL